VASSGQVVPTDGRRDFSSPLVAFSVFSSWSRLLLMEAVLVFCSILNPIVTELEYNGGTCLPLVESRTNNDRLAAVGYGAVSCLKRKASAEIIRRRATDREVRELSYQRSTKHTSQLAPMPRRKIMCHDGVSCFRVAYAMASCL
jgi:hypothetical protein